MIAGSQVAYSYDANSNRLSALDKTTSDTDLDGQFDADDFALSTSQASNLDATSNRLLRFSQTLTKVRGTKTLGITNSVVNYSLDANGNLSSDGLRSLDCDESNRLVKIKITKDGEAASISYLTNALGQRTFKGEPKADQTLPSQITLGTSYIDWLKKNFSWLFTAAQANTSVGTAFTYADADAQLPSWALLGEYDNGSAASKGRTEYIWLPTEDGSATPIGTYRSSKLLAVHTDHLGRPRLVTDNTNTPVWQWPYSAFGNNKSTGILKATPNPRAASANNPVLLRATAATAFNLRFPGQYADDDAENFYNYSRNYQPNQGRYVTSDPIGLEGGLNRYAYAKGAPTMFTDPLGLWAVGFEAYGGIGGGVSCTCSDGKLEITSRLGTGAGSGFGFDPNQAVSPHATGSAGSIARSFVTAGAELKGANGSIGASGTGRSGNAVTTKVGGGYAETSLPQFGSSNWQPKVSLMAAFGVEFGGYMSTRLCK